MAPGSSLSRALVTRYDCRAMRRRSAGVPASSWAALGAAALIVALFVPFPPLLAIVKAKEWTLLIEWIVLSAIFLGGLSWMEGSNMEVEISTSGFRIGRSEKKDALELAEELRKAQEDLELYRRLIRELAAERSATGTAAPVIGAAGEEGESV